MPYQYIVLTALVTSHIAVDSIGNPQIAHCISLLHCIYIVLASSAIASRMISVFLWLAFRQMEVDALYVYIVIDLLF